MAKKKASSQALVPASTIERRILLIRKRSVMLDRDLAALYRVAPIALRQAVKRNQARFPDDFAFQLTSEEADILVSQTVIPSRRSLGGSLPYCFTEQGVAMLSSVLRSERAIAVNIAIMRTFVRLRQIFVRHKAIAQRLLAMEQKYDHEFKIVFDILRKLTQPPSGPTRARMGFVPVNK